MQYISLSADSNQGEIQFTPGTFAYKLGLTNLLVIDDHWMYTLSIQVTNSLAIQIIVSDFN